MADGELATAYAELLAGPRFGAHYGRDEIDFDWKEGDLHICETEAGAPGIWASYGPPAANTASTIQASGQHVVQMRCQLESNKAVLESEDGSDIDKPLASTRADEQRIQYVMSKPSKPKVSHERTALSVSASRVLQGDKRS